MCHFPALRKCLSDIVLSLITPILKLVSLQEMQPSLLRRSLIVVNVPVILFPCHLCQNAREPSSEPQTCSSTTSVPKSGSSGMIQYLQSWFPGWGGWYGESQDPDRPQELLQSPSSWNILGELGDRGTFDKCQLRTVLHLFFICL